MKDVGEPCDGRSTAPRAATTGASRSRAASRRGVETIGCAIGCDPRTVLPAWLGVAVRAAPSANVALVRGREPLLVDGGEGQAPAIERTLAWLGDARPARLVLTHWHPDHAGAVAWLARERGVAVLAHEAEADLGAHEDPCDARWLGQPVARYAVDTALRDGDVVEVPGGPALQVVATPGQTAGHIALWEPEARVVLTGDLLQRDDVAWLPLDDAALEAAIGSVERLGALGARLAVPGHGPVVEDVAACVERTLARYERWRSDRAGWAWHGARRLVAAQAVLRGPAPREALLERVGAVPALGAMSAVVGEDAAAGALAALLRSGALAERGGRIVACFPHEPCGPWVVPPDLGPR